MFALKVIGGSAALMAVGLVFYVRGRGSCQSCSARKKGPPPGGPFKE
jgi:hypothetical protein